MDETISQAKPGIFGRIASALTRSEIYEDEVDDLNTPTQNSSTKAYGAFRARVTVRRQITSFDDATAAANGLKRGEHQILNLAATEPATRQKIFDFMSGVNFAHEGTWEEIGDNIYLIAPSSTHVEVAPPTSRGSALRN